MSAEIPFPPPQLIETLRYSRDFGFARLDYHLARLKASSEFLGHQHDPEAVKAALAGAVKDTPHDHLRVRLEQTAKGLLAVTTAAYVPISPVAIWQAAIVPHRLDPDDALLAHKTTRRAFYDDGRVIAAGQGADEAIFLNTRDEVCEGGITSIFLPRGDVLLTPPLACGLLAGCLRAELLDSGAAREEVLKPEDLKAGFLLGNSLRGLIRARLK